MSTSEARCGVQAGGGTPESPEDGLGRRLHILRLLVARTLEEGPAKNAPSGVTYQQLDVLNFLASRMRGGGGRKGVWVGNVATHLNASMPSASRILSRLERVGLVSLEIERGDKRRKSISLTDAGFEVVQEQEAPARERLLSMLGNTDAETAQRWQESLDGLIEALLGIGSNDQHPCLQCRGNEGGTCLIRRLGRVEGMGCRGGC